MSCEFSSLSNADHYVVQLFSQGGTRGWFYVKKTTGEVREYHDMDDTLKPQPQIDGHSSKSNYTGADYSAAAGSTPPRQPRKVRAASSVVTLSCTASRVAGSAPGGNASIARVE